MKEFVRKAKLVTVALVALLVVIVVLQNTESVETKILFYTFKMPRAALLFGTLIIGFATGVLTAGRLMKNKNKTTE